MLLDEDDDDDDDDDDDATAMTPTVGTTGDIGLTIALLVPVVPAVVVGIGVL